ncbi:hypothetical protein [Tuwongella immobilis]|uniref:Hypothetical conserved protein n=1 Tax=Tuwongella immobilis TaxID=692036 RepID=A0A6C2YNC2_9BACT|nr:hypothetical protein [Tuwongella immobilis]VIP02884.1 Hypothetical conserved protein OS=uncultured planctomycete GN=HGMM_F37F03C20 PE=4 SV=1 [Tuwongella immobilis]VTS02740.1 Hypothetical conserved protein OS=uncultured planctomycete GN=HGMM_F37F03C20 PE=4 SV=1 [Tuwongella immobilis]
MATETATPEVTTDPATLPRDRLSPIMFVLSVCYLLLVAGLIHRYGWPGATAVEKAILLDGVLFLWPIFFAEGLWRLLAPSGCLNRRHEWGRFAVVLLFPPARMGSRSRTRRNQLWLPRLGFQTISVELARKLERGFSVPMIVCAALLLPILVIEYTKEDLVRENPVLALVLQAGIAIIWVAFAFEFILKCAVAPKLTRFLKERWLDASIVILPMLEFLLTHWVDAAPLARLLRLGRAISPEQLARMNKLYRLRGLLMKAWHAFMLLEIVGRVLGTNLEKRLARLRIERELKLEELQEIDDDIAEIERRIRDRDADQPATDAPPDSGPQKTGEAIPAVDSPSAPNHAADAIAPSPIPKR